MPGAAVRSGCSTGGRVTIAVGGRQGDGWLPLPRHGVPLLWRVPPYRDAVTFLIPIGAPKGVQSCASMRPVTRKALAAGPFSLFVSASRLNEEPKPPSCWETMGYAPLSEPHSGGVRGVCSPHIPGASSRPTACACWRTADGAGGGWQRRHATVAWH